MSEKERKKEREREREREREHKEIDWGEREDFIPCTRYRNNSGLRKS